MARLGWDQTGQHLYETGTDHGVVYPAASNGTYPKGYAWNGITGWTESPSGADETALYADNIKYLSLRSAEEFGATLTAYTYPDAFADLDGSAALMDGVKIYQQARKSFGLAIRTLIGNDIDSNDHGYLLHLVYGLTASPSERSYSTVNDSPEAIEFSWEMKSVPVNVTGKKPTSVITIDSTKISADRLAALENVLYGTDAVVSYAAKQNPVATVYSAVAEPGSVNPSEQDTPSLWYERSGEEGAYVYTHTSDSEVDGNKTYYTRAAGDDPHTADGGWYERSGEEGSYVYTLSADTEIVAGTPSASKTYYVKSTASGTDARLPLPDEVISILSGTSVGG